MENSEWDKCRYMYVVRGRRVESEFEHIPSEIPGHLSKWKCSLACGNINLRLSRKVRLEFGNE